MGRLNTRTKLGQAIARDGRPSYIVGALCGIHAVDLSHYINMHRPIPPHHMRALSEILDAEPEDLIGWVEGHEPEGVSDG